MCHGDRYRTRATEEESTAASDQSDRFGTGDSPEHDREKTPAERPTISVLSGPARALHRVRAALSR